MSTSSPLPYIKALSPVIAAVIVVLAVVLLVFYLIRRVKRSAAGKMLRELNSALKTSRVTEEEIAATPRSLSGMDSIYLPKIHRDFPEFSWDEWRGKIEDAVRSKIKDKNGQIYQTVISRYTKDTGVCRITAETSASYLPGRDEAPEDLRGVGQIHIIKDGKKEQSLLKRQAVFETELLYVQNAEKIQGRALGVNCPNCGAPFTRLGDRTCPYCGSAVIPVNLRVWRIGSIRET